MGPEAPWKGSLKGVAKPTTGEHALWDVWSREGACHSETAHADIHGVGLEEVGGAHEIPPVR